MSMPPFFCTLQHISCTLLRIPGNVPCACACRILRHRLRRCQRTGRKYPSRCCCPNSLIEPMRNKWLRIPYQAEYILPSFLHLLPPYRKKHNDYIELHIVNMHLCKFCRCDNLSYILIEWLRNNGVRLSNIIHEL